MTASTCRRGLRDRPCPSFDTSTLVAQASKATLLKLEDGAVHAYLANMRVLDVVPVETLVARAGELYQRFKPAKLIATRRACFRQCAVVSILRI